MNMKIAIHAAFIIAVVTIGILIGITNLPGSWYAQLVKPAFNPPNWVFGPVWTVLYAMIGFVGARTWLARRSKPAMKLWFAQMALNFAWSPLFFGLNLMDAALVVIIGLWISILLFIRTSWKQDRLSAALFLPYLLWVTFATLLNVSLIALNPV
jgi:translocator protein